MRESRIRPRSVAALAFGLIVAAAGMTSANQGRARLVSIHSDDCYYAGGSYSMGACRGGQRCVRGVNDEDYWQDDGTCDQVSPGGGGRRQI
ncbi:MAG TPA: hypothetical protein VF173_14530 [Thermoanaerobaculia bacterium]|nr:hypothetical protein [Thermoanaerobaculia bacterium]